MKMNSRIFAGSGWLTLTQKRADSFRTKHKIVTIASLVITRGLFADSMETSPRQMSNFVKAKSLWIIKFNKNLTQVKKF